jgi:cyclase
MIAVVPHRRRTSLFARLASASAVIAGCAASITTPVAAQSPQVAATGGVRILPVRGSVYMILGAGGNITVSVGRDGVLLVDAGSAQMTDQVLAAIRQLQADLDLRELAPGWGSETKSSIAGRHSEAPPKPIRYIINTQSHADHAGGNEKIRAAGRTFTGGNVAGNIADAGEGAAILAHEHVLERLSKAEDGRPAAPSDAQPTDTYYANTMKLSHFFNGEGVQLIHQPSAASDGDSLVYFRGSDVIAAGDVFLTNSYPIIDTKRGGSIDGVVAGLNRILDLSVAEFRTEGGTLVVPGHGRLSDSADVAYYRDMVTILRDRIKDMVDKEMTLDEVKAAKPTADYDPRYATASGPWTADMFIEAAYTSLGGGRTPRPRAAPRSRR